MADEVRANPTELARVAERFLAESEALFDGLRGARDGLSLTADMIGDTPSVNRVVTAHNQVVEAAGTTVERLIAVLEEDVDGLYQTAFSYQQTDQEAAEDLGGRLPIPDLPIGF